MNEQKVPSLSLKAQSLINSLIGASACTYSEFPIQAMKARKRTETLSTELKQYILELEKSSTTK